MDGIGRSFGFYIRHWDEMQALYEEKDSRLAGLSAEERKMIERVGDRAREQAANFLMKCEEKIIARFETLGTASARKKNQLNTIQKWWEVELPLRAKGAWKSRKAHCSAGISIQCDREGTPHVFLWLWSRGRNGQGAREVEEVIAGQLGKRVVCRGSEMEWYTGLVAFGRIPLEPGADFTIDQRDVLNKVDKALGAIDARDVRRAIAI